MVYLVCWVLVCARHKKLLQMTIKCYKVRYNNVKLCGNAIKVFKLTHPIRGILIRFVPSQWGSTVNTGIPEGFPSLSNLQIRSWLDNKSTHSTPQHANWLFSGEVHPDLKTSMTGPSSNSPLSSLENVLHQQTIDLKLHFSCTSNSVQLHIWKLHFYVCSVLQQSV